MILRSLIVCSCSFLFFITRPNFLIVVDENKDELVINLEEARIPKSSKTIKKYTCGNITVETGEVINMTLTYYHDKIYICLVCTFEYTLLMQ